MHNLRRITISWSILDLCRHQTGDQLICIADSFWRLYNGLRLNFYLVLTISLASISSLGCERNKPATSRITQVTGGRNALSWRQPCHAEAVLNRLMGECWVFVISGVWRGRNRRTIARDLMSPGQGVTDWCHPGLSSLEDQVCAVESEDLTLKWKWRSNLSHYSGKKCSLRYNLQKNTLFFLKSKLYSKIIEFFSRAH